VNSALHSALALHYYQFESTSGFVRLATRYRLPLGSVWSLDCEQHNSLIVIIERTSHPLGTTARLDKLYSIKPRYSVDDLDSTAVRPSNPYHSQMYSPEYVESDEDDSDEEMLNRTLFKKLLAWAVNTYAVHLTDPQLPSLLSHLSLSGTFNTSSDSHSPPTFDLTPAPTYNSRPGNSINLFGEDKRNRSTSPSSRAQKVDGLNQDKRRVGIEFQNRTKKAKLNHRYFRSQDLLSPPHQQHQSVASTSRQVTPSTSRVPSLTSSKNTTPTSSSASSLLHKPVIPSRLSTSSTLPAKSSPAWWPSVSLSSGEGRVSRFAPRESQFVGDGKGWIDPNGQYPTQQVAEMNGSSGMSSRSIRGISTDRNGDRPRNSNRSRSIERRDGIDSDYGRDDDERNAAEAMLELHELGYNDRKMSATDELQLQREEARSTPQKEELMSVLRARVNNAGGTTTGAQSGLRFKKLVLSISLILPPQITDHHDNR
jgi:hypothetical protein